MARQDCDEGAPHVCSIDASASSEVVLQPHSVTCIIGKLFVGGACSVQPSGTNANERRRIQSDRGDKMTTHARSIAGVALLLASATAWAQPFLSADVAVT